MGRHRPAPGPRHALRAPFGRLLGLGVMALLMACASPQAAIVRAATLPDIQVQPGVRSQPITAPPAQAPAIRLPEQAAPSSPAADFRQQPATPTLDPRARPSSPALPTASSGPRRIDARLEREIVRLRQAAEPRSGFGTTQAAANAAWTLGLIELHGGLAPSSPAQAQVWFERAARFGRQPLAYAGLAWCAIDGCKGAPDPSAARQAIAKLRPHHRARSLYLQWLLDTRLQPLMIGSGTGPEGVHSLRLPMRDLLESAAAAGDSQARIELGIEAMVNGDLEAARNYFAAAAPRSRAAAADLELLDLQLGKARQAPPKAPDEAQQLFERAQRAHRGAGVPVNYAEALRLYQAAANKGSASAKRMLGLIVSRPQPDGSVNLAWMAQLAWLDTASSLPRLDTRALSSMMYRDPTPLFDLLPDTWQRALTTVPQ